MSQNIIVPKRKRDDDSDDEQPHHPLAKQQKMFAILPPRSEATTPSRLPIPGSCKERYMKINFRYSPLPKYRKIMWHQFVETIKYVTFIKAVDQMRTQAKLPPLSRVEMEAAWYQKSDEVCKKRGLPDKQGATELEKLMLREYMISTAMNQRRDRGANRWWEEQKKKHPDLDVEIIYDNQEADKMQDHVDEWMAMAKDGFDPPTQWPFSNMTPAQVNFIKITCEAASRVKEAINRDLAVRPKSE